MDRPPPPRTSDPPPRPGDHPLWLVVLLALAACQGWLTLGLFDGARPFRRLLDGEPVVSGRHPLHLYHGFLGARSLRERGTSSCYDPAFQAGYPKTPVFDSGSRPAELVLALSGGHYRPEAYKVGLAVLCAAAAGLLAAAARGAGLSRAGTCAAAALAMLVWWGRPCRDLLESGDVDLLLASVLVVAQTGLLLRYHHRPGLPSLAGVVAVGFLGWFAQPVLMLLLLPLFMIYYLSVGARHPWFWHAGLLPGLLGAIAANAFWLLDWFEHWWIMLPLHLDTPLLAHRTLATVWHAALWGTPADRTFGCLLAGAALAGAVLLNQTGRRPAARLFGGGALALLTLAGASLLWEPLGRFGAVRLLVPGLLFAAVPAGHALAAALAAARRWTGWGGAVVLPVLAAAALWLTLPEDLTVWGRRLREPQPLQIGLGAERRELLETLTARTTAEARILWEDRPGGHTASHWTALLPVLTERAYVGGLDPDAGIEHTAIGLADQALAGRSLSDWTAQELLDYCERYNVGWVVCWSEAARAKFAEWADPETGDRYAEQTAELHDEGEGWLFTIRRRPSFALKGSAKWLSADAQRVVLEDVRPEQGQVLLSLHYQAGLRATPSRVRLQRAEDKCDRIDFVRLLITDPSVTRVTITWEKR